MSSVLDDLRDEMSMDEPPEVNILLLGDAEVGKSTFLG